MLVSGRVYSTTEICNCLQNLPIFPPFRHRTQTSGEASDQIHVTTWGRTDQPRGGFGSHRIHVWHIYLLYLPCKSTKYRYSNYTIHESGVYPWKTESHRVPICFFVIRWYHLEIKPDMIRYILNNLCLRTYPLYMETEKIQYLIDTFLISFNNWPLSPKIVCSWGTVARNGATAQD